MNKREGAMFEAQSREVAALRRLLLECAEELEADVKERYGWPDVHPAQKRKFERDMELVNEAKKKAKGEE